MVIEHDPLDYNKFQLKVFNWELYCYEIEANISIKDISTNLGKTFLSRLEKIDTAYCLFNCSDRNIHGGIITFLAGLFPKIIFASWI